MIARLLLPLNYFLLFVVCMLFFCIHTLLITHFPLSVSPQYWLF